MVKLRLKRMGSKRNAQYKIVAADARAPRDGKFIEALGNYDPKTKKLTLNEEATQVWIKNGAQLTDTVYNLFRTNKLNIKFTKKSTNTMKTEPKKDKVTKKVETKKTTTKTTSTKKTTSAKKTTTK